MIDSPTTHRRLAGAASMAAVVICLIIAFSFYLDSAGSSGQSVSRATSFFTYMGIGAILIGWKYPNHVLWPLRSLSSRSKQNQDGSLVPSSHTQRAPQRLLGSTVQRALFAAGVAGLVPWFAMRVIRQLWTSHGLANYLSDAILDPLFFWFNPDPWWDLGVPWYDRVALPSFCLLLLAIAWPWTGARLLSWVRAKGQEPDAQ